MKYRLVCITHGDGAPLVATLASFYKHVSPAPTETALVWDGCTLDDDEIDATLDAWDEFVYSIPPVGFCHTCEKAWQEAAAPGIDWVFWLEHDFEFLRDVDLTQLAKCLRANADLAQVSLLREPVGHEGDSLVEYDWKERRRKDVRWLEQSRYWTTNPSLFPAHLARGTSWPIDPQCEGRFTIKLRADGHVFGVFGDGSPWIRHTGERTGFGY